MKKKILMKSGASMINLFKNSFLKKPLTIVSNKFPILNKDISHLQINFHSFENEDLSNSQNISKSKNNIKNGIIWLKKEYFKVPKLILSKNNSPIKTPISNKHFSFSEANNKIKLNKTFRVVKNYFPNLHKNIKSIELFKIMNLKKVNSENNIYKYKKKRINIDRYNEQLSFSKFSDNGIPKYAQAYKVGNHSRFLNKGQNINNIIKKLYPKNMKSLKNQIDRNNKDCVNKSFNNLLNKKVYGKRINKLEYESKIHLIYNKNKKFLKKHIDKCNKVYKKINFELKNLYSKKKKEIEKIIEDESNDELYSNIKLN
jgi:hypothetical protein